MVDQNPQVVKQSRRAWMALLATLAISAGLSAAPFEADTGVHTLTTNFDSIFMSDDGGGPTTVDLNSGIIDTFVTVFGGSNGGVTLNINGGTLANTGSLWQFQINDTAVVNVAGGTSEIPIDVNDSAQFNYTGGTFNGGLTINNTATATITGATYSGTVAAFNSGRVVLSSSTLNSTTALSINSGAIVTASGSNTISGQITNNTGGQLNLESNAVVTASGGGTSVGAFSIGSGAELNFSGGTQNLNTGANLSGQGSLRFGGATANLTGTINMDGTSGQTRITSGTVNFNAGVTVTSFGSALNITGGTAVNLNTALTFNQAVNISGNNVNFNVAPTFNVPLNQTGGTVTVNTASTVPNYNMTGGTLRGNSNIDITNFTWGGGTMADSGVTRAVVNASLTGSGTRTVSTGRTFTNDAALVYSATGNLAGNQGAMVNNNASWDHQTDADFTNGTGTGYVFSNAGTFTKSAGTATTQFGTNWSLNNLSTGQVVVNAGTLQVSGGGASAGMWTVGSGDLLRFDTGTYDFNTGTNVSSSGTVTFNGGTNNLNAGSFTANAGVIVFAGGSNTIAATIGGAGNATFSGGVNNLNSGATVNSSGTVTFSGGTTNLNSGASLAGSTLTQFTTGGTHNLAGDINLTGGSARMNVTGGTVNLNSGVTFTSVGTGMTVSGGTVNTNADTAITHLVTQSGGSLAGTAKLTLSNFAWTGGAMTDAGITEIAAGGTAVISGTSAKNLSTNRTLTNKGTVTWSGTGDITANTSGVVINNDSGALFDAQNNEPFTAPTGTDHVFNNAGTFRKSVGVGATTFNAGWTFNNTGTVDAQSGTLTFGQTTAQEVAGTLTGGTWVMNGTTINLGGGANSITTLGASSKVVMIGSSAAMSAIDSVTQNDGHFEHFGLRNFTTAGAFTNNGTLIVNGGANFIVNPGSNLVNNGTIQGDSFVTASAGGMIINNGTINPGNSAGALGFTADFQQSASGQINIEIGGTVPGSQHDTLSAVQAALNGTLNISLINSFNPGNLETFQIMTYSGRTGTFANVLGLHHSATERFHLQYNANNITLVNAFVGDFNIDGVVDSLDIDQLFDNIGGANLDLYDLDGNSVIANSDVDFLLNNILHRRYGDANLDGSVDALDIGLLRANLGLPNTLWATADFNGDGNTDAFDVSVIRANLGLPPPGLDEGGAPSLVSTVAVDQFVPEPSGLALLGLASVLALRRRSSR
jgi:hypothetical protein